MKTQETEIELIKTDIKYIKDAVDKMQVKLDVIDNKYLLRDEFEVRFKDFRERYEEKIKTLERIVYSAAGLILTAVFIAIVNSVIKK